MPTLDHLLQWGQKTLAQSQRALQNSYTGLSRRESRLLLAHALGIPIEQTVSHPETMVTADQSALFKQYIQRRLAHEPLSRIMGTREFWSLPFELSPETLDPRPETELIIEKVLANHPQRLAPLRILDLGTGSGCLVLTLLTEYPQAFGVGIDLSSGALRTALQNAKTLHVQERLLLCQTVWGKALKGPFDLIVSNPPYIPTTVIETLDPNVKEYDPHLALDGGEDGLACYRFLADHSRHLFHHHTQLYLEIGQGQHTAVETLFSDSGYTCLGWHQDGAGIPRCGIFVFHGKPADNISSS